MAEYQPSQALDKGEVRSILDALAREGAQQMLIGALDREIEEFLGRARYERVPEGRRRGYRNGSGKPRKVAVGCGTLKVRAPRLRDTVEPFTSQILPRYQRASAAVRELLPELYLQGLATGGFEPALRSLLGEAAPLSPASIVRLKAHWQQEYEAWRTRPLTEHRYAYLYADGLYLKAGPVDEHLAVLIVIGVREDGSKELLAMIEGYREEAQMRITAFADRFGTEYPRAVASLTAHQEELLTYYDFPQAHWRSLRSTNPIESIFDQVRLRTQATRRMRTAQTGLHLVFQLVHQAQTRWHKIEGAHLVSKVLQGVRFVNGIEEMKKSTKRGVAA